MMKLEQLLRPNIAALSPYSSARSEYSGEAMVFLDANENPFNAPYNRYPDPLQKKLKEKIAKLKGCSPEQLFIGNGSDEAIDLLFRAFCNPEKDNMVTMSPSYGMYQVAADINQTEVRSVFLDENFQISADAMLRETDEHTKLLFLCSPNNPSGNLIDAGELKKILNTFQGIVVLDEAYIDFSPEASLLPELSTYPNLVILQTFSKAWGMAGIRLGIAIADPAIISVFNNIKYPYNINCLTQTTALELVQKEKQKNDWVELILSEREKLVQKLKQFSFVLKIYPSDANFILVKVSEARNMYQKLVNKGIIVRDRSKIKLCDNCLRITVGSPEENKELTDVLFQLQ